MIAGLSSNGTESVIINPVPNEVYDAGGNLMSASEATDQYFLLPSPTFNINSDLSSDNGYFRLIFEEGPVFSDEASTSGLGIQDFKVLLTSLDGEVEEVFPLYVVDQNNNLLDASGADTVKLDVNLDFIPTGGEIVRIFPKSSNAITRKIFKVIFYDQRHSMLASKRLSHYNPYTIWRWIINHSEIRYIIHDAVRRYNYCGVWSSDYNTIRPSNIFYYKTFHSRYLWWHSYSRRENL